MKECKINVSFLDGIIDYDKIELVQNDYNSTKFVFNYDVNDGTVSLKMLYPDETAYVEDVTSGEFILTPGLLNQEGFYQIELSSYANDGRLTGFSTMGFFVRNELIDTDNIVEPDDRVPILDSLINQVDNIDISAEKVDTTTTVSVTKKDGTSQTVSIEDGVIPTIGNNGNWYLGDIDTGRPSRGATGETGATGATGPAGQDGRDGVIQYTAGDNITIDENNVISASAKNIQYDEMPEATEENLGEIIQYVGETDEDYTKGYYYQVISETSIDENEEETTTYAWTNINVQPATDMSNYYTKDETVKKYNWNIYPARSGITDTTIYEDCQDMIDNWIYVSNNGTNGVPPRMTNDGYVLCDITEQTYNVSQNYKIWKVQFYKLYNSTYYYFMLYFYTTYNTPYVVYDTDSSKRAYIQGRYSVGYLTSHQSLSNYLSKTNTTSYTPTSDYHPATKKYVDDKIGDVDFTNFLGKDNTTPYTPTGDYNPATKIYAETYANGLFNAVNGLNFEFVSTLPSTNISTTTIYIQGSSSPYNMYVYVNSTWELIGTTQLDLDPEVITNSASTYTIATLNGNKSYKLGEITSLEISATTVFDRETTIYFSSGSTATEITIPTSITNLGDNPDMEESNNMNVGTCSENTNYIISIMNNVAFWKEY